MLKHLYTLVITGVVGSFILKHMFGFFKIKYLRLVFKNKTIAVLDYFIN
jgi:hypothetical protein